MRLFFAMFGTETNTFSPIPTGWGVWRDTIERYWPFGEPFGEKSGTPLGDPSGRDS